MQLFRAGDGPLREFARKMGRLAEQKAIEAMRRNESGESHAG
jgi:hypothetical protein